MSLAAALPAVNATLNGTSGALLLIAYVLIKRKRIAQHRRFMLASCVTSLVFLCCYVLNHYLRHGVVTHFTGTGAIRPIYFTLLTTHTILAITIVPMRTNRQGTRRRAPASHARATRATRAPSGRHTIARPATAPDVH